MSPLPICPLPFADLPFEMEDYPKRPARPRRPASGSWQQSLHEASSYISLGMQLALTMVFFVVGGHFLDRWLATAPWLLLVGAVLGMTAVFVHLFHLVAQLNKKSEARRKAKDADETPVSNV